MRELRNAPFTMAGVAVELQISFWSPGCETQPPNNNKIHQGKSLQGKRLIYFVHKVIKTSSCVTNKNCVHENFFPFKNTANIININC